MIIKKINIFNFRNIGELLISPFEGINLFAGENAQGKSNALEALVVAVTGRAFRTNKDAELIKWGENKSRLSAVVDDLGFESRITVDLDITKGIKKRISIENKAIKRLSQFISRIDSVIFSRNDLLRISGEPFLRRSFLDRLISMIKPEYLFKLQKYHTLLRQKSLLLKQYPVQIAVIDILNEQLSLYGAGIILDRESIVKKLSSLSEILFGKLFGNNDILELEYVSQNKKNISNEEELCIYLKKRLDYCRNNEIDRKMILEGIQRDDILITINKMPLKIYGSQGQKRFASVVLKLAEGEVYNLVKKKKPIIFMDDCFSEIDDFRREYLWRYLSECGQVFLTANDVPKKKNLRIFMIKEGKTENIVYEY